MALTTVDFPCATWPMVPKFIVAWRDITSGLRGVKVDTSSLLRSCVVERKEEKEGRYRQSRGNVQSAPARGRERPKSSVGSVVWVLSPPFFFFGSRSTKELGAYLLHQAFVRGRHGGGGLSLLSLARTASAPTLCLAHTHCPVRRVRHSPRGVWLGSSRRRKNQINRCGNIEFSAKKPSRCC